MGMGIAVNLEEAYKEEVLKVLKQVYANRGNPVDWMRLVKALKHAGLILSTTELEEILKELEEESLIGTVTYYAPIE